MKYNKYQVFENLIQGSGYARTIYTGKIKKEYIGIFTEKDVAEICDDYNFNFGNRTTIYPDGTFECNIYID